MALIFADDFQQLAANASTNNVTSGGTSVATARTCADTIVAYGFDRPLISGTGRSSSSTYCAIHYGNQSQSLSIGNLSGQPVYEDGVLSLNRKLKYTGDTLYFSFVATIYAGLKVTGKILAFGNSLYTLSILSNYNYALNGVDTGVLAYYENTSIKLFHEIIIGPDFIEFWISNDLVARQSRTAIPVDYFQLGFFEATTTFWRVDVHSLIICDNAGTEFNTRIGRKTVKTFIPEAVVNVESTLSAIAGATVLTALKPTASSQNAEAVAPTIGSLISPDGYVTNSFTTTIDKTPLAALINVQTKRRSPSGDGMTAVPYVKIGDTIVEGNRLLPSSLWNVLACGIPSAAGLSQGKVEFGYVHDYVDMNKVFISDRTGVAVYGWDVAFALRGSGYVSNPIKYRIAPVDTPAYKMYVMPYTNPKFAQADVSNILFNAYTIDYAKTSLKTVKQDVTNTTFNQEQTT